MNKCLSCENSFVPKRNTSGKYCSYVCYWQSLKGKSIRPKTGKNIKCKICGIEFYSQLNRLHNNYYCSNFCRGKSFNGKHLSPQTEFKKGRKSERKGKKFPELQNENNANWKGNKVSYSGLHNWVKRHLSHITKCQFCGTKKNLHWANKNHTYLRNLNDWLRLCAKCHRNYDIKNGLLKIIRDKKGRIVTTLSSTARKR